MLFEAEFIFQCESETALKLPTTLTVLLLLIMMGCCCSDLLQFFCFPDIEMKVVTLAPVGEELIVQNRMAVCEKNKCGVSGTDGADDREC